MLPSSTRRNADSATALLRLHSKLRSPRQRQLLELLCQAQINAANVFVANHFFGGARHQNLAIVQDIGAINHAQGLPDVVIRYQHTDTPVFQVRYQFADFANCNRIDTGDV